jgi:hypothetical protein
LWEWRAFGKTFHKNLLDWVGKLPVKRDRPTEMADVYLWMPDRSSTIKIREQGLKIKRLLNSKTCHLDDILHNITFVQQWTTEAFTFPISDCLISQIITEVNLMHKSRTFPLITNKDQFVAILQSLSNSLRIISVFKEREQHLFPINGKNNSKLSDSATIEISWLRGPEEVTSINIEHIDVNKVLEAVSKIMTISGGKIYTGDMKYASYLETLKVWALDKKLFDSD